MNGSRQKFREEAVYIACLVQISDYSLETWTHRQQLQS